MSRRVTIATLLVLIIAGFLKAQEVQLDTRRDTRWMLDMESGSESGLGYKLPHIAVGFSVERPVANRFELQGGVSYSPDKKYITNDGNSLKFKGRGIFWITPHFAVTGSLRHSSLWTSQFSKSASMPMAGVTFREALGGYPGRIYLDILFPTGCQWGPNCPIQSNRTKGAEIYWENRIASHVRLGVKFGFYHILNQSNQFRPDIPRTGQVTGDTVITLRYEFHTGSLDKLY